MLDGGAKTDECTAHVQLSDARYSEIKVPILPIRAGGLGLNLQTTDIVIMLVFVLASARDLMFTSRRLLGRKQLVWIGYLLVQTAGR